MAARAVQALPNLVEAECSHMPGVVGRRAQGAIKRLRGGAVRPLLGVHAKRELDFSLAPGEVQKTLAGGCSGLQVAEGRWVDDHHVVEPGRPSPDCAPAPPSRRGRRPNRRRSPCRRRPGCHRRPGVRRRARRCRRRTEPGSRHAQPALCAEAHRRTGRARSLRWRRRRQPSRRPRRRGDRPSRAGPCHRQPRLKSGGGHAASGARARRRVDPPTRRRPAGRSRRGAPSAAPG